MPSVEMTDKELICTNDEIVIELLCVGATADEELAGVEEPTQNLISVDEATDDELTVDDEAGIGNDMLAVDYSTDQLGI